MTTANRHNCAMPNCKAAIDNRRGWWYDGCATEPYSLFSHSCQARENRYHTLAVLRAAICGPVTGKCGDRLGSVARPGLTRANVTGSQIAAFFVCVVEKQKPLGFMLGGGNRGLAWNCVAHLCVHVLYVCVIIIA